MNRNSNSFKRSFKPIDPRLHNLVSFFANNQRFVYTNNNFLSQKTQSIHTNNKGSPNYQTAIFQNSFQELNEKVSPSGKTKSAYEGPKKDNDVSRLF